MFPPTPPHPTPVPTHMGCASGPMLLIFISPCMSFRAAEHERRDLDLLNPLSHFGCCHPFTIQLQQGYILCKTGYIGLTFVTLAEVHTVPCTVLQQNTDS